MHGLVEKTKKDNVNHYSIRTPDMTSMYAPKTKDVVKSYTPPDLKVRREPEDIRV